jgi:hypothetical protein
MEMSAKSDVWPIAFFVRRWRRQVPLGLLFWRDMIVVGSLLNLAAAFAGLLALGFKAHLAVATLVFFSPLPYNVFLVASVWRAADLIPDARAWSVRAGATIWLVIATLI